MKEGRKEGSNEEWKRRNNKGRKERLKERVGKGLGLERGMKSR